MSSPIYSDQDILAARAQLWHMGNIEWKLDPTQKKILDFVKGTKGKISVINCARRLGKSYFLTIMAIQQCLTKPKSIVKFLQPEQKMIRMNIKPIMEEILKDCPPELRPEFKTQDNVYIFKHNGSQIQLAGTDSGNAEKLRGGDSDLSIIDEAAFVKGDLPYIIRSILLPTTLLTRGKIILSSTSPTTPDHPFAKYMESAEEDGRLIRKTIYDALDDNKHLANPRFTQEILNEIINEYPEREKSDDFRRECLCIIIVDGSNSVLPEFTDEVIEDTVIEWPRPVFCDKYVSMDIGFKDLTVALFAYYDFQNGVIVIEDEVVMNGSKMTTDKLAEALRQKEIELWTNKLTNEFEKPCLRVADNNYIVLNDLQRLHGLTFLPTSKDNKDAAVNNVRMMISNRQIIIHPRCKILISHMRNATWDKNRAKFTRNGSGGHHYDAVDSICYLVRNLDKNRNPFPKGYKFKHIADRGDYMVRPGYNENQAHESFKDLFKPRKSVKN